MERPDGGSKLEAHRDAVRARCGSGAPGAGAAVTGGPRADGEIPIERFERAGPQVIPPESLVREAFLFFEWRTVTKTATVSLFSNHYEVDSALVGRRVELVFDPFDLEHIEVRYMDTSFGTAVPQKIGRHSHPMARPVRDTGPTTGIDYLALVESQHRAELGKQIAATRYAELTTNEEEQ